MALSSPLHKAKWQFLFCEFSKTVIPIGFRGPLDSDLWAPVQPGSGLPRALSTNVFKASLLTPVLHQRPGWPMLRVAEESPACKSGPFLYLFLYLQIEDPSSLW